MAYGKIVADQIQHSSEGTVGTQYVVSGVAKAWVNFNGTGTIAARDSLNVSSLTDNGTGLYTPNLSSPFANTNFCVTTGSRSETNGYILVDNSYYVSRTVSSCRLATVSDTGGAQDGTWMNVSYLGDLA